MPDKDIGYFNPYGHGFARVAVAVPRVASPTRASTRQRRSRCSSRPRRRAPVVVAFPELGISAYTCDDLLKDSRPLFATAPQSRCRRPFRRPRCRATPSGTSTRSPARRRRAGARSDRASAEEQPEERTGAAGGPSGPAIPAMLPMIAMSETIAPKISPIAGNRASPAIFAAESGPTRLMTIRTP